jgi:transglutaminase-like putative cysteine protease
MASKPVASDALRHGAVVSLLLALTAVLVPHVPRLPVWVTLGVVALLAWRAWRVVRPGAPAGRWTLIALTILGTCSVVMAYGPRMGRDASVALLAIMLALKVQELRTLRDAVVITCLGFFVIITDFLYSQTMATAAYMALATLWLMATLVAFQDHTRTLPLPRLLRISGTLLLQGLPLMAALFLLFPRIQGPMFGLPQTTAAGVTGLSETMSPGSLSALGLSDEVAFRVQFHSPAPKAQHLYWRGPVLWDFDGRTWTIGPFSTTAFGPTQHETRSPPLRYTVTLEPHYQRWLFAIDLPASAPREAQIANDYQLLSMRPVRNRIRYDITSHVDYSYGIEEHPALLQRALRLPSGYNPEAVRFARALRERSRSDAEIVAGVLQYFHSEPFFYTLVPPELGRNSVDEFLFETRRGFCEHYASAFVFLMRAAGVPARVVTGYQGGQMNPVNDYLIVRQSEAHAWAEVWLPGQGWIRVDPTAAVSPARIQVGIGAALPASEPLPLSVRGDYEWMRKMRFAWDAVANSWNQWVLGYSPERQMQLLRKLGFDSPSWHTLITLLMSVCAVVLGIVALRVLGKLRWHASDPVTRDWARFCRKLAQLGTARRPEEGPREFARRAASEQPDLATDIATIAQLYVTLRYDRTGTPSGLRQFRDLVRAF